MRSVTRRRLDRGDGGFTLVEMLVSMAVFGVIMAAVLSVFVTMTNQARDTLARTQAVENARLGISQIDRQIRSGNLILDPALDGYDEAGVPPNYSLRVYTQADGDDRCVQWRVLFSDGSDFGDLQYRSWEAGNPGSATAWSIVASNVVAPVGALDPDDQSTWPPFWIDSTLPSGTAAQNIRITLRLSDPLADEDAKPMTLTTVVTGRNTVFGYSSDNCSSIPTP